MRVSYELQRRVTRVSKPPTSSKGTVMACFRHPRHVRRCVGSHVYSCVCVCVCMYVSARLASRDDEGPFSFVRGVYTDI